MVNTHSASMSAPTAVELWQQHGCSMIPVKLDKKPACDLLPQVWNESERRNKGVWKPFQEHTATSEQIKSWITARPAAFAIVTGKISGRITFDFDGDAGVKLAQQWSIRPHRRTGSGGLHLDVVHPGWYVPTLNQKALVELGKRFPGLDVKGDGGYCIAIGRNDKGPYVWLRDPEPDPIEAVPAEVWEFLSEHSRQRASSVSSRTNGHASNAGGSFPPNGAPHVEAERLIRRALDAAPSVGRNNAGFDLACQLRDNGYSESEALGVMRNYRSRAPAVNTKGQNVPYTDAELGASIREVFSRSPRASWTSWGNGSGATMPDTLKLMTMWLENPARTGLQWTNALPRQANALVLQRNRSLEIGRGNSFAMILAR